MLAPHSGRRALVSHRLGCAVVCVEDEQGLVIAHVARHRETFANDDFDLRIELNNALPDPSAGGLDWLLRGARISGSAEFADDLSRVLRQVTIDPGGWVAPFTGDVIARRIEMTLFPLIRRTAGLLDGLNGVVARRLSAEGSPLIDRNAQSQRRQNIAGLITELGEIVDRVSRLEDAGQRTRGSSAP